jgi:S-formylglutathione hydrolase FrmB
MYLAKERARDRTAPKLFLCCGSEDFLFERNKEFHEYLDEIEYEHAWWVKPGVHDYDFWNAALPASLEWLAEQQG